MTLRSHHTVVYMSPTLTPTHTTPTLPPLQQFTGVAWQRRLDLAADDDVPAKISICLPRDQFYSRSFFECFDQCSATRGSPPPPCAAALQCHSLALRSSTCKRLTSDINQLCPDAFSFSFVPTFGQPLASALDLSESVCFDFDFDQCSADGALSAIDLIAAGCDEAAVADMHRHAPNLMHAVDNTVRLEVIMSSEQYKTAINTAFINAASSVKYTMFKYDLSVRSTI